MTTNLAPGVRVRLHAPSPILTLRSPWGTVIEPDLDYGDLGYWLVALDEPATYHHGRDAIDLSIIREHADNLTTEPRP